MKLLVSLGQVLCSRRGQDGFGAYVTVLVSLFLVIFFLLPRLFFLLLLTVVAELFFRFDCYGY